MVLSIKDPEADRLARALAAKTGETITAAIISALRERMAQENHKQGLADIVVEEALAIGQHCSRLPVLDARSLESMLYDENGLPK